MFAIPEIAEVARRNQGKYEAAAGIVSEAVYCPLASLVAAAILSWSSK